jgi:branched-chain amino acid transport system ATP-binding protein
MAVNGVCLKVEKGDFMGLIGPNGAGKTTLMRVITGTVKPTVGSVFLKQKCLDNLPSHDRIRSGIGLSQQIVHPFASMTVLENVVLVAGYEKTRNPMRSIFNRARKREEEKALDILKLLNIDKLADKKPTNLPLGYLKRLEVARALALDPVILLLDEPLAGLNQSEARELADKLQELNGLGQTILLIEHNLGEIVRICNKLAVIDNGMLISTGQPKTVMNEPGVRKAYLGERSDAVS